MEKWKFYRRALIPCVPPYETMDVDRAWLVDEIKRRKAFFARWVSDFDCGHPTGWWYCLRDMPIELNEFKSKVRNEINRGLKTTEFFLLDKGEAEKYMPAFYEIATACYAEYPPQYRPSVTFEQIKGEIEDCINRGGDCWVCIDKETGVVNGYCEAVPWGKMLNMVVVKVLPAFMRNRVNAGLVFTLCQYYLNSSRFKYLSDGERNIRHKTNYQSFLCKTLGFRLAYCHLNIVYHPWVKSVVKMAYPFRSIIGKLSEHLPVLYNMACVLRQEEYART